MIGIILITFIGGAIFMTVLIALLTANRPDSIDEEIYQNGIIDRDTELKELKEEHEALKEIHKLTKIRMESLERTTRNQSQKILELLDTINKQDQSTIIKVARSN
jgi:predicted transcriptional regulator